MKTWIQFECNFLFNLVSNLLKFQFRFLGSTCSLLFVWKDDIVFGKILIEWVIREGNETTLGIFFGLEGIEKLVLIITVDFWAMIRFITLISSDVVFFSLFVPRELIYRRKFVGVFFFLGVLHLLKCRHISNSISHCEHFQMKLFRQFL